MVGRKVCSGSSANMATSDLGPGMSHAVGPTTHIDQPVAGAHDLGGVRGGDMADGVGGNLCSSTRHQKA